MNLPDDAPEARAVVHFAKMGEFMRHNVVDYVLGKVNQPPVQTNARLKTATAPTRACGRQGQRRRGDVEPCGKVLQALGKQQARLFAQGFSSCGAASFGERRQSVSTGSASPAHTARLLPVAIRICSDWPSIGISRRRQSPWVPGRSRLCHSSSFWITQSPWR